MAGSVNKVILIGNLGKDPEVRSMQNGGRVATLSLATSENWKDKVSGEKKEKTEWHRVVVFDNLAEIAERYLKKGNKIYVCGQLQTRKWTDQSGSEKYTTEVIIRGYNGELTMLDGKSGGGATAGGMADEASGGWDSGPDHDAAPKSKGRSGGGSGRDPMDDEIPF